MLAKEGGPRVEYRLVELWEGLTFDKPVKVASPAGDTNRLFVVERPGLDFGNWTNRADPTTMSRSLRLNHNWQP